MACEERNGSIILTPPHQLRSHIISNSDFAFAITTHPPTPSFRSRCTGRDDGGGRYSRISVCMILFLIFLTFVIVDFPWAYATSPSENLFFLSNGRMLSLFFGFFRCMTGSIITPLFRRQPPERSSGIRVSPPFSYTSSRFRFIALELGGFYAHGYRHPFRLRKVTQYKKGKDSKFLQGRLISISLKPTFNINLRVPSAVMTKSGRVMVVKRSPFSTQEGAYQYLSNPPSILTPRSVFF